MKEYLITVNGKTYEVQVEEAGEVPYVAPVPNQIPTPRAAPIPNPTTAVKPEVKPLSAAASMGAAGKTTVKSPMPGSILKINVAAGDTVKSGTVLCVLEAMKMENEIVSPCDGLIATVNISKGASVNSGDVMFTIN